MSLERHERGIHALRLGAGGARVTEVRGVMPGPAAKELPIAT